MKYIKGKEVYFLIFFDFGIIFFFKKEEKNVYFLWVFLCYYVREINRI